LLWVCPAEKRRAVSFILNAGTEDPIVPWEGGELRLGRLRLGKVLSARETVMYWVTRNGCVPSPRVSWEPDRDPEDGTRVRRESYDRCRNGAEVVFYMIEGGGHSWPGGLQYFPEWLIGKTNRDMEATEVIWEFFKKHTL